MIKYYNIIVPLEQIKTMYSKNENLNAMCILLYGRSYK